MIELQIINKVLQEASIGELRKNDIDKDYFVTYIEEISFIFSFYDQYSKVPDTLTFLEEFGEFDIVEVGESWAYLIEKIQEQYTYKKLVPFVRHLADLTTEDAFKAVSFLSTKAEEVVKLNKGYKNAKNIVGVDETNERLKAYEYRRNTKGLIGIPTGLEELDNILHGWLRGEDFVVITGRTNEGKSWVLLFFLLVAWKSGEDVLLYSGEMSHLTVGFRFDTLSEHFSAEGLMKGSDQLGDEEEPKSSEDYHSYLTNLSKSETPFYIVTPKDIGSRLTIPTLHRLIEEYSPKIVGIDQLSLMEDYRAGKGENTRIRYTHISEDLYLTSEKYGIPILSPAQASRDSVKDKKSNDSTPELTQVAESDGIVQNATRVISIKQVDNVMKLSVKKNRYGRNNIEIMTVWDIDKGIVRPFLQTSSSSDGSTKIEKKGPELNGEDLF